MAPPNFYGRKKFRALNLHGENPSQHIPVLAFDPTEAVLRFAKRADLSTWLHQFFEKGNCFAIILFRNNRDKP